MKTFLFFITFFISMSMTLFVKAEVQSIDLNGEFPLNSNLIIGQIEGELFGAIQIAEVNGDSHLDLVINGWGQSASNVFVFLGPIDGNQNLTSADADFAITPPMGIGQSRCSRITDVNGDGIDDLVIFSNQSNQITTKIILGGTGLNSLTGINDINSLNGIQIYNSASSIYGFESGNLNGDDFGDILIETNSDNFIFYGNTILGDTLDVIVDPFSHSFLFPFSGSITYKFQNLYNDNFDEIIVRMENEFNLNSIASGVIKIINNDGNLPIQIGESEIGAVIYGADNYLLFGGSVKSGNFFSSNSKDLVIREGKMLSGNPSSWTPHNIYVLSSQQFTNIDTVDLNQTTPEIHFLAEFGLDSFLGFNFQKVNDDEFDDLVITDEISGGDWEGKVYVYFGGNPNLSGQIPLSNETADLVILGGKTNDYIQYPEFVDLNSDGYKDTIIPIPGYDTATQSGVGAVMIVWGDSLGFDNDPIPSAGEDQIGEIDSLVFLDGSETYDIDGDSLSFLWTQVSGTTVSLQNANQETASFVVPNTATNGEELIFSLEVTSNAFVVYDTTKVTVLDPTISAEENSNLPKGFSLSQNFPNPFNPTTVIGYQLPVNSGGKLVVFNILGEVVKEFELSENKDSVVWNGTDSSGKEVGSGIYFYRLEFGKFDATKKMLLLR